MTRLREFAVLAAFGALALPRAACAQAAVPRAWAGTIDLPTWEEGLPDPLPHLRILDAPKPWYPYAVRANFGTQKRVQAWRALNLENDYLACVVLPDLGGRLYRCRDKLSGYEMFHANPSVKKANIALRGAWAASGVELNFPQGHSLLTVSPVEFRIAQGSDSASVWVGSTDRVTGMRWRVEFRLERNSAVLLQNVRFENPSGARQQYQWWSNAGVTLHEDTRFVLPARQVATHGMTRVENWPVGADGIDRSDPAKYPGSLGLFAHGPAEAWFAVFQERAKLGTLHLADPAAMPGKKFWVWGKDDDREIRAQLSDDGSQYVEMQAGLFENQETFGGLEPGQSREFSEYWMPLRGLSGVAQASRDAVLWVAREGGAVKIELMATRPLAGAVLRAGGSSETVTLDPAKLWSRTIANAGTAPLRVELRDASGALLLGYTEGAAPAAATGMPGTEGVLERDQVKEAALARWAGDGSKAKAKAAKAAALDPTDPVARFEEVRQGAADPELWRVLAADPERVLEVADAYLQWGLDRDAAVVLGYRYAPVPGNWMEPGAAMPQDYPLVAYYRGYVHRKLEQYAAEDFRLAASLPVRYCFPSRASSRGVLEAAIGENPGDASAHYLLGLWFLNAGDREAGGRELQAANRLRPELAEARGLLAAMKLAAVAPPAPARKAPATRLPVAPTPTTPTAPTPTATPTPTPPATRLPAVPTPTRNPIGIERAVDLALGGGGCGEALRVVAEAGTEGGARLQYFAGVVEAQCGNAKAAARRWERVGRMRAEIDSRDYVYPQLALAALKRPFDAASPYLNVRRALESATGEQRAALLYNQGLLLLLQGQKDSFPDPDLPRLLLPR